MLEERKFQVEKNEFFKGGKDCIPTLFGYLSIGFACGVVSKSCGITILETVAMSTFIYAGSSQFIAATFVGACFSSLIYDYKKLGLDFALPAMFIALLISSLKENHQ